MIPHIVNVSDTDIVGNIYAYGVSNYFTVINLVFNNNKPKTIVIENLDYLDGKIINFCIKALSPAYITLNLGGSSEMLIQGSCVVMAVSSGGNFYMIGKSD